MKRRRRERRLVAVFMSIFVSIFVVSELSFMRTSR